MEEDKDKIGLSTSNIFKNPLERKRKRNERKEPREQKR